MQKLLGLTLAVFLALAIMPSTPYAEDTTSSGNAKNAILFIGDGMGVGTITLLLNYAKLYKKESTVLEGIMRDGRVALCFTQPLENLVPECSSAGTAMATGQKTNLLRVSQQTDGTALKTILEYAQDAGKATGIVTTQRVTHSTPAVFSAHVERRDMESEIADQQVRSDLQVLMGGGRSYWVPKSQKGSRRNDSEDLIAKAKSNGFTVLTSKEQLVQASGGDKILGLFADSHLPFALDAAGSSPSLAEMTRKAIEVLSASDKGFVLVVEQGALDQIQHENDAAGTIAEMKELDKALGVALDFYEANPDTLILVTSDHDTGGLTLSAREDKSLEMEKDYGVPFDFAKLEMQRASSHGIFEEIGNNPSSRMIQKTISENTAYDISEEEAIWIKVFPVDRFFPKYGGKPYGSLGKIIAKKTGIVWVSQYHTFAMVPLIGVGPGSEQIVGLQDNVQIFHILKDSLDV